MNRFQKTVAGVALVGATLTGGALGATLVSGAGAQTTSTAPANQAAPPGGGRPAFDPARGGHVGANGTAETLLTGDTAEKVKAAALAAVPGGTIQRVETDAEAPPMRPT